MKLEFSQHIFEKYLNIKFHENPFCGSRVPCGRADGHTYIHTDMKLIVAFRNFANAPEMDLQEVGWGRVDWLALAQDRDRSRALVSAVMNLRVPYNAGNLLTS